MRPNTKKTDTITVRVDEATKSALERLALDDDRKLSAYCARVLKAHVDNQPAGKAKGGRSK